VVQIAVAMQTSATMSVFSVGHSAAR
jgi:hypothetical protein